MALGYKCIFDPRNGAQLKGCHIQPKARVVQHWQSAHAPTFYQMGHLEHAGQKDDKCHLRGQHVAPQAMSPFRNVGAVPENSDSMHEGQVIMGIVACAKSVPLQRCRAGRWRHQRKVLQDIWCVRKVSQDGVRHAVSSNKHGSLVLGIVQCAACFETVKQSSSTTMVAMS